MVGLSTYFDATGTPFIYNSSEKTISRNGEYIDEKNLLDSIVGYGGSWTNDDASDGLHISSGTFSFDMLEPGDYILAKKGSKVSICLYVGKNGEEYRLAGNSGVTKYTANQASALVDGFDGYVIIRKSLELNLAEYGKGA